MEIEEARKSKWSKKLYYLFWGFFLLAFATRVMLDGKPAQKPVSYTLYALAIACCLMAIVAVAIESKKNLWQTLMGVTGGALLTTALLIDFHRGWFALIGAMLLLAVALILMLPKVLGYMRGSYHEIRRQK